MSCLLLGAGGLVSIWILSQPRSDSESVVSGRSAVAPAEPVAHPLPVSGRVAAAASPTESAPRDFDEIAEPRSAESEPGRTSEREFYERLERMDIARVEAEAEHILRGSGPDPEKVALLRFLLDRRSERAGELSLLALRELPDDSAPHGESVPSTALILLDRRALKDPLARATLARAAFEAPWPSTGLRSRAAASFFQHAQMDELLARRADLAREQDPLVLESALEALSRNPDAETAARLLAPYGRQPVTMISYHDGDG